MFACLISGSAVNTECQQLQPDQFLFPSLPFKPNASKHLAVFTTPACPSASWPSGFCAAIFLRFAEEGETGQWKFLGSIGEGKESAFFKVQVPESIASRFEILNISIGISILPTDSLPNLSSSTALTVSSPINTRNESLKVAKKLLDSFINYVLSFSRTFSVDTGTNESYIPAKIITEWYNSTVRKSQIDPEGFVNKLMREE